MKNQIHYILTQIFERLNHGRLVVPESVDGGVVVVEEVDPVALQHAVGPGRLPPGDLQRRLRHAQQAHVPRGAGRCKQARKEKRVNKLRTESDGILDFLFPQMREKRDENALQGATKRGH